MDAISENAVLGGRVRLLQPQRGYRAGLDAALLAAAARRPQARFTGLERDPAAAALARRNVALNGLEARVDILEGDVAQGFRALGCAPFDAAFANPPYFDDPAALRAPAPERRGAWIAEDGLTAWTGFLLKAVRDGGTLTVIHRADRLGDLLGLLAPKAGSIQVRPVHPFADAPAKRVLVRALRGGRAPLKLLPPLVLHARDGGKHTPQAEAILRGEAALAWA